MGIIRWPLLFLLGQASMACGNDGDTDYECRATEISGEYEAVDEFSAKRVCTVALSYAAQHTKSLIPDEDEVSRYYHRLSLAVRAEPLLARWGPVPSRIPWWGFATIYTTNPLVISAWKNVRGPAPRTSDPDFDSLLMELTEGDGAELVSAESDRSPERSYFTVRVGRFYSEMIAHERLMRSGSSLGDVVSGPSGSDWRWSDDTYNGSADSSAVIDVVAGWGDCTAGCAYTHRFQAVVSPTGAQVYDLGGDPLPPDLQPAPTTLPPP